LGVCEDEKGNPPFSFKEKEKRKVSLYRNRKKKNLGMNSSS
jgi:hypothetical protein